MLKTLLFSLVHEMFPFSSTQCTFVNRHTFVLVKRVSLIVYWFGCTLYSVSTKLENSYVYMDILYSSPDEVSRKQSPPHSLADNPGLLPSSCQHHWGRILALGSLSLKVKQPGFDIKEKTVIIIINNNK